MERSVIGMTRDGENHDEKIVCHRKLPYQIKQVQPSIQLVWSPKHEILILKMQVVTLIYHLPLYSPTSSLSPISMSHFLVFNSTITEHHKCKMFLSTFTLLWLQVLTKYVFYHNWLCHIFSQLPTLSWRFVTARQHVTCPGPGNPGFI